MRTRDGLWLDVTRYGPDDAPVTVFLAHCWTPNQRFAGIPTHVLAGSRDVAA